MASVGRSIRAGSAYVEMFVRDGMLSKGLQAAQKKLRAFGDSMNAVGRSLATAGAAGSLPFGLSLKVFADFDSQMARVQALTSANANEFAALTEEAKRLGRETVFTSGQAAEAMSKFALAGFSISKILKATDPALQLAAAGQIEIAEAADIATKIMAGMGVEADDLGGAIDVLAKAMTTANTDILMLGDAFKFVGPIAKSAGISFEEITAAIQLLSNAGVQGEMAGTSLRGMILSLATPSKEAAEMLTSLGVSVQDAQGNFRPLADIIGDLEAAMAGFGSAKKLNILGTIFPDRQAAGAAELVSKGAAALKDATKELESSTGTAGRIAGRQLDTLAGDFELVKSAIEGLALSIGESLSPALRAMSRPIQGIANWLNKVVKNNKGFVITVAAAAAGALALGSALLVSGFSIAALGAVMGAIATIASAFAGAIGLIGTILGAILSPIGLAVTAITGLVGYFLYATGAIGKAASFISGVLGYLTQDATAAMGGVRDALAGGDIELAAKIVWVSLRLIFQRGIGFLQSMWIDFKAFFQRTWAEAVLGAASIFVNSWAGLQRGWSETIGFLSDAWTVFANGIIAAWHEAIGFIKKAWVRLKSLFDSDVNVDAEVKRINEETDGKLGSLRDDQNKLLNERDEARRKRAEEIESERQGILGALDEERQRRREAIAANQGGEQAALQAELDALKSERDALLKKARDLAQIPEDKEYFMNLDEAQKKIEQGAAAASATISDSVRGTFSATEASMFGGQSDAMEETAKNTAQLIIEERKTRRELKFGAMVAGAT